jgi:hypothetical protein
MRTICIVFNQFTPRQSLLWKHLLEATVCFADLSRRNFPLKPVSDSWARNGKRATTDVSDNVDTFESFPVPFCMFVRIVFTAAISNNYHKCDFCILAICEFLTRERETVFGFGSPWTHTSDSMQLVMFMSSQSVCISCAGTGLQNI